VTTINEYRAPNPKDTTQFVKVHVQRATDLAFTSPVDVGVFPVDTSDESTLIVDTQGTLTSYYRHRHEDAAIAQNAPAIGGASAVSGYGLGIGQYLYKVSLVSLSGETPGSSDFSGTTTLGNQKMSLTSLPLGPAGTTARKIYRTAVGGVSGSQKYVATINDNTTTTYSDTTPDASLSAPVLGQVTEYSTGILFGDYWARQQIRNDIPDGADLNDNVLWDGWRDQTLLDMQALGLGRPADPQDFTPASTTDYTVALRGDIRRVTVVEIWRSLAGVPFEYWTAIRAWEQRAGSRGRSLRIMKPKNGYTYRIYGVGELRDLNDMDDELWNILYWGIRWRYMLYRGAERVSMRPFLSRTRQSDTTTQMDFKRLADDAKLQFDQRVVAILYNEGVPSAGAA